MSTRGGSERSEMPRSMGRGGALSSRGARCDDAAEVLRPKPSGWREIETTAPGVKVAGCDRPALSTAQQVPLLQAWILPVSS